MPTKRIPIRKVREILRLTLSLHRSHRETSRSMTVGVASVGNVLGRAQSKGLRDWTRIAQLPDDALERAIYGPRRQPQRRKHLPDPSLIHAEIEQTGTTLESLHRRYRHAHPDGYCYSTFCDYYRVWRESENRSLVKWKVHVIANEDGPILRQWRRSADRRKWERAVVVLDSNRGHTVDQLVRKTERGRRKIIQWIASYNERGLPGISSFINKRRETRAAVLTNKRTKRVLELLHHQPRDFDINRSNWSLQSMAAAYENHYGESISKSTISKYIRSEGYSFRRARKVLCSPDPEYKNKVGLVLKTLHSLDASELFFFVDELGPLRVKKFGGRSYVKKGSMLSFPQQQPYKGSVTLAGALSATTNQTTWIFVDSKDSSAMIDLIEVLFNRHHNVTRLYITWDAASWHRSNALVDWLDEFNRETQEDGLGPIIEFIPLPTSSQFLDVIEAVFSGMKRAVVHHSDYQSEDEMKAAISGHFAQRNLHFAETPRRAGKRIWDLDFFGDYENLRSGNYREW